MFVHHCWRHFRTPWWVSECGEPPPPRPNESFLVLRGVRPFTQPPLSQRTHPLHVQIAISWRSSSIQVASCREVYINKFAGLCDDQVSFVCNCLVAVHQTADSL